MDLSGRTIAGRYQLRRIIGQGGIGVVYEAEELGSGAPRAVKMLRSGTGDPHVLAERFRREARAIARLAHPNIVEAIDFISEGESLFLVMELVAGTSVTQLIERRVLTPRRTIVIARQVLEALTHAHAHGLVHRDIKPDNIMVMKVGAPGREHDRVKLLDFGLVKLIGDAAAEVGQADKLTQTGVAFGTPAYMSPEQALARFVDDRTDLYSLGIVIFEMLTGRKPFDHPEALTLLRMHVGAAIPTLASVAPDQPWVTFQTEALIARALAKYPDERYANAGEMMHALIDAFLSLDHLPADC